MLRKGKLARIKGELPSLIHFWRVLLNSQDQFAGYEYMCRARPALARKEMEYWLAEAEEWKQIRELPEPFIPARDTPDTGYSESN
jgi:hypothetical protein